MDITPQGYGEMCKAAAPHSNVKVNALTAFVVGGAICAFGQILLETYMAFGIDKESASMWTSVTLIVLSSIATGMGWYQRLARHAGAGTLVPITGFSNAITSSAIEARSEGYILGVGTKIFTIAGPVILYGCAASFVYGMIYYAYTLITS